MQGGPKIDLAFFTRFDLKWNKWIHSLIAYHLSPERQRELKTLKRNCQKPTDSCNRYKDSAEKSRRPKNNKKTT